MARKTIFVERKFDYTNPDGTATTFKPGKHTVDEAVADHWFVQAHLVQEEVEEATAEEQKPEQSAPNTGKRK